MVVVRLKLALRNIRHGARYRVRLYRAKRARANSGATFIGVTGSSGKSTTATLLAHLLAGGHASVYSQVLVNSITALISALCKRVNNSNFDYVVSEVGARGKGSIGPMVELLRPSVAIVTMVRLEHFKNFRTLENVAEEKRVLVDALPSDGLAILNVDDPHVKAMAAGAKCRVVTFGMSDGADYRISDVRAGYPDPLTFKVHWKQNTLALTAPFPADYFWLPLAAATVSALELGVPPEIVASRLETFLPLQNRCEVFVTEGGPEFIIDTAKAPWHSINLAIDFMSKAAARRKRIVLGQISDYAGSSRKYAAAYQSAREAADQVIYVGDNAHRSRAGQADRDNGRFREIRSPKEVSEFIKQTALRGELILLKSSANLHLERVALSWTHDVRCWETACGKEEGCRACGLYQVPFEQHRPRLLQRRRARRWEFIRHLLGGRPPL
ncbi:Mur ligase family protein [Mesorhizobium loti]|uniref:Mur ligase family protein n=1 Tax=Rhizobium loti TaxID=381 RepID=UPI0004126950|nr:Mur ligase family protein [Mesorhizobium loti]